MNKVGFCIIDQKNPIVQCYCMKITGPFTTIFGKSYKTAPSS